MPRIILAALFTLLLGHPVAAQVDPAAPKEAVTLEINADLLRRAQALHIDLAALLEVQLASAFADGGDAAPAAMSH